MLSGVTPQDVPLRRDPHEEPEAAARVPLTTAESHELPCQITAKSKTRGRRGGGCKKYMINRILMEFFFIIELALT